MATFRISVITCFNRCLFIVINLLNIEKRNSVDSDS